MVVGMDHTGAHSGIVTKKAATRRLSARPSA